MIQVLSILQPQVAVEDNPPVPAQNAVRRNGGLSPCSNRSKEKYDFFSIMVLQMQNEASHREHEAREQAENRTQLIL